MRIRTGTVLLASLALAHPLWGQGGGADTPMRQAARLDSEGKTAEARVIFQKLIDEAADPAARAAAQRAMAMSWAFEGNCAKAVEQEEKVIAYWVTREQAEPQNAFFQQGELANEVARVCIDAGDLATAEKWYRKGTELGMKEPAPRSHSAALWDFRLAHALARLAARRGDKAEAAKQVAAAKQALASDTSITAAQSRFLPYLTGYVALFTGELATAQGELGRALEIEGNARDPFMTALMGMVHEKMGHAVVAREWYQKAYDLATGHNPPAAFARPFTRKKLAS